MAKHKAIRGPIKVGDTGEFGKYGENDNIATIANRAKHKAMRGRIKVGDTGDLRKYPFYLWINVFCLPLLVGHSSRVPAKRKKGIEENETVQPAGTVHEL